MTDDTIKLHDQARWDAEDRERWDRVDRLFLGLLRGVLNRPTMELSLTRDEEEAILGGAL